MTYRGSLPPEPPTGRLPGSSREVGVGPASAQVREKATAVST